MYLDTHATEAATARPVVEVAAGVIQRADGSYLLAQRPAGKVYAGYWEFPGGKLEAGESVEAALIRELNEELDIHTTSLKRWRTLEYDYPHAYVRLFFCKVMAWQGEPVGNEGQIIMWQHGAAEVAPIVPATLTALSWLIDAT
jgi:8-oxo-dGTP diphosphatase